MKVSKENNISKKILNSSSFIYRSSYILYIFLLINIFFISGCSALKKNEDINICSSTSLPCLLSTEYVLLITNKGKIKLELYGKSAQITVGSFIDFVEKGAYDNTIFNRGKLLNVGYKIAKMDPNVNWDCYVFHDVDLYAENDNLQ